MKCVGVDARHAPVVAVLVSPRLVGLALLPPFVIVSPCARLSCGSRFVLLVLTFVVASV